MTTSPKRDRLRPDSWRHRVSRRRNRSRPRRRDHRGAFEDRAHDHRARDTKEGLPRGRLLIQLSRERPGLRLRCLASGGLSWPGSEAVEPLAEPAAAAAAPLALPAAAAAAPLGVPGAAAAAP